MKFGFGLYSSVLLIFIFHGFVFSVIFLWKGFTNKIRSDIWLGCILFLLCLYIAPFMLGYAGWYSLNGYREFLFYMPFQQLLLIGPCIFFYTQSLLHPEEHSRQKVWFHFMPGILYLMYSLIIFIGDRFILSDIYFYQDGQDKDFDFWYQMAGFISMTTYFVLGFRYLQSYQQAIFNTLSYAEEIAYRWVRHFLLIFLSILLLRILFFIINPEWGEFGRKFWYYLAIGLTMYYLAIQGYKESVLSGSPLMQKLIRNSESNFKSIHIESDKQSENQSPADLEVWIHQINQLMETESLYKNPILTLRIMADHLNTNTKIISAAINQGSGLNFNDFVNRFRVNAIIEELESGKSAQLTLLAIALSCGFNSKSTFNRAFKKFTGMTPKEFIDKKSL